MTDAERIAELEDALIEALCGEGAGGDSVMHLFRGYCPSAATDGTEWDRDPDCPACQRLERLIGHRRPGKEGA